MPAEHMTPEEIMARGGVLGLDIKTGRPRPLVRETGDTPQPREFGRLRVLGGDDLLAMPPVEYLVDDLIPAGGLCVGYGAPKCGKTFLLLHVAYAVAQGREVFGKAVKKRPVLYVAAEGQGGFGGRYRALMDEHGPARDFHAILQTVDLFNPDADLSDLIEAAAAFRVGLVVLDTLARVMVGGDENATRDMATFVANCDRIRQETGAAVLVVHHCGWGGERLKGSINLLGAADMVWRVTAEVDGTKRAEVETNKEGPAGAVMTFRLPSRDLGMDPRGKVQRTCIVEEAGFREADDDQPGEAAQGAKPKLSPLETAWSKAVTRLFANHPERVREVSPVQGMPLQRCISRTQLREWGATEGLLSVAPGVALTATDRSNFLRATTGLKNKGFIGIHAEWVWML